jgi:hypothetical protein
MVPTGPTVAFMLLMLTLGMGRARAADRFVSPAGADAANDCSSSTSPCRSVAHALGQAVGGDTVKLAGGDFEGAAIVASTNLVISGGWSSDFAAQDIAANETVVRSTGQTFAISAVNSETIDLTLDGLIMPTGTHGVSVFVGGTVVLNLTVMRSTIRRSRTNAIAIESVGDSSVTVTVANSTVGQSAAPSTGTAITIYHFSSNPITVDLLDSMIERNRGAGVSLGTLTSQAHIHVVGCTFFRNHSVGLSTFAQAGHVDLEIEDSLFVRNKSRYDSGAVHVNGDDSVVAITNSTFVRNATRVANEYESGGLMIDSAGSVDVVNSTFWRNRAPTSRYGATSSAGVGVRFGTVALRNSIVWGNRYGVDLAGSHGAVINADHADIGVSALTGGTTLNDLGGNISTDPVIDDVARDPGGLHLTAGSPCIDSGTCTGAPATDFEGDPRPTGTGCDMGADEFVP